MMAYNSLIHGLVTREQFCATYPQNPLVSGLRQSYGNPGTAGPVCGVTKPKARSPMGFLLSSRPPVCGTSVVQVGLSSYTSTPELERRAKTRSGWYVGRLRVCARPALSLVNAIATNWLRRNTKADTVSLR